MACYRCEEISTMKVIAHVRKKKPILSKFKRLFHLLFMENKAEEAVVRTHEEEMIRYNENGSPWPSYLRVHHSEMNRPFRKVGEGIGKNEGPLHDVLRVNVMGDVYNLTAGIDLQDPPLHGGHIMIFCPKIGQQGDDGVSHGLHFIFSFLRLFTKGFRRIPFSVMMASMSECGVTSKAGLNTLTPPGVTHLPPIWVTSSPAPSSIGMSFPEERLKSKVEVGAPT